MLQAALLAELTYEAENTRKLFDAITNDVLDYQPNNFNWTIAQLASHTAEVYNWWEMTLHENVFDVSTYKYENGDISSIDTIKQRLEENIARAIKSLENYPEEKFMEMWSMENDGAVIMPPMPRIQVIRSFLMNHLYHHRGELISHLRANGKRVPGLYGPTFEDQLASQNS